MFRKSLFIIPLLVLSGLGVVRPAHAQFAVIDVGAIVQMVEQGLTLKEQLDTLGDQLKTARDDLAQAREAYRSTTGGRGMEQLLRDAPRNYLPSNWEDVVASFDDAGSALGSDARRRMDENAGLSAGEVDALWPDARDTVVAKRRAAALRQSLSRTALATTSARFASLNELITAIARAPDMKAAADLEARATAELAMLQNEATKNALLTQSALADQEAARLKRQEHAIADVGSLRRLPPMGL